MRMDLHGKFNVTGWRYAVAVVIGLVFTSAFPPWNISGAAWVAPGALLVLASGRGGGAAFRYGFVAGLAHHLSSLYWLLNIPVAKWMPIMGWMLLSVYLALYIGVWSWACNSMLDYLIGIRGDVDRRNFQDGYDMAARGYSGLPWITRFCWILFCGMAWVALELVRSRFMTGFPWNLAGASQYENVALIQIARWTGIFGVSFLVVWDSAAIAGACLRIVSKPLPAWNWLSEIIVVFLVAVFVVFDGMERLEVEPSIDDSVEMSLVQPSFPQTLIWDEVEDMERFSQLESLSKDALDAEPDMLVWPESAFPGFTEERYSAVTNMVSGRGVYLIFVADEVVNVAGRQGGTDDYRYYNSAFLMNTNGNFLDKYRKRRLVVFGEYVPLSDLMPFLDWFTPISGGFSAGEKPGVFHLEKPEVDVSMLICFEDVFPDVTRASVMGGTDILLNLTNDGWFGDSAAQAQHAINAVFRAVENNVPVVRCTNNGLTCWIDARGRIKYIFKDESGGPHGRGFDKVTVGYTKRGNGEQRTFYNLHGDLFAYICLAPASFPVLLWLADVLKRLLNRRDKKLNNAP